MNLSLTTGGGNSNIFGKCSPRKLEVHSLQFDFRNFSNGLVQPPSVFQKPVIGETPKVNQWIAVYRVYYIPYIFPNGGDLILVKVAQQLFVDSTNPGVSCLTESFPFYRILVCTILTWTPMDSAPQLTQRFNFHTGTHGRVYKVADEICGGFNAVKVIRHRY